MFLFQISCVYLKSGFVIILKKIKVIEVGLINMSHGLLMQLLLTNQHIMVPSAYPTLFIGYSCGLVIIITLVSHE